MCHEETGGWPCRIGCANISQKKNLIVHSHGNRATNLQDLGGWNLPDQFLHPCKEVIHVKKLKSCVGNLDKSTEKRDCYGKG